MRKVSVFALFFLAMSASAEDCEKPYKVDVPDGASADEAAMVDAQKAIKAYLADANAYLACLEEEDRNLATAILSEEAIEEQRALTTRRHNAMVDEMEAVAEAFNVQVRAFKAANPG